MQCLIVRSTSYRDRMCLVHHLIRPCMAVFTLSPVAAFAPSFCCWMRRCVRDSARQRSFSTLLSSATPTTTGPATSPLRTAPPFIFSVLLSFFCCETELASSFFLHLSAISSHCCCVRCKLKLTSVSCESNLFISAKLYLVRTSPPSRAELQLRLAGNSRRYLQ